MIRYETGNLFDSDAEAWVNAVNTVGVMGKGIALQFKNMFPKNFKHYFKACKSKDLVVGKILITEEESPYGGKKIIINFPTKTSWRKPSEYIYIEEGLIDLVRIIKEKKIKSIAIPALGAGNGGLDWNSVKILLEKYLEPIADCDIHVYVPSLSAGVSL